KSTRVKLVVFADHHLPRVVVDLNHIERRARGHAESLALADGEIVNPGVLSDNLAVSGDHLAGNISRRASLLVEIGFQKALVVAAGDETNFLRVGLFGNHQIVLAREFANFGLGHAAEWEQGAAQLLLREAEEEVSLVFTPVSRTLQQPAVHMLVKDDLSVMAGGNLVGANLPCYNKKLIKLQVIVAQTTRDRRAPGQVLFDKRTHHIALEALLVIHHVVGDAQGLGHAASIVNVVDRAAPPLHGFRHAFVSGKTALIPELHGQADDIAPFGAQHGRNG